MEERIAIANYYSEHLSELRAFVRKATCGACVSDDIVQEVFARLLESSKMITPITLPALVHTMARNMVYDYWRHHSAIDCHEHYVKRSASDESHSYSVYSTFEINDILERGMARLRKNQREIYRLSVVKDMKISDIVKTTGEGYKSVEARLCEARRIMREYVARKLA